MEPKRKKKSVFRIILGIIFFTVSIVWIADRIIDNQFIRLFDWFYTGIMSLNGIIIWDGDRLNINNINIKEI